MSLQALREKRAKLVADMRGLLDAAAADNDRDLNEEEVRKYDAAKAEVEALNRQITRLEEQETIEAGLNQSTGAVASRQGPGTPRAGGDPARREFENVGEFMHSVRFNPNDQRLASLWSEFDPQPVQGEQRMDTGSSGGFAIPQQFRDTLLSVSPQEAAIRPGATVLPAGTPPDAAITIPALDQTGSTPDNVYGGVTVDWISEGADKPETDANLREIKLEPQEVAGHVVLTDKLLRNWAAASALIERLLRGAIISAEDFAFLSGNGIGKPLGIINAGASYLVNRAGANAIGLADIQQMVSRILMRGGVPTWLASQSIMPQLLAMKNEIGSPPSGDGALVWQPNARDSAGNQLLMGYPIKWNERSPQLGTKGDLVLADRSYYLIKDGSGPFVAASEHVHFTKNKTVIKIFWNVDGQPWLTEPFTQEGGYEVSPFVVLDVPA